MSFLEQNGEEKTKQKVYEILDKLTKKHNPINRLPNTISEYFGPLAIIEDFQSSPEAEKYRGRYKLGSKAAITLILDSLAAEGKIETAIARTSHRIQFRYYRTILYSMQ